MKNQWIEPLIRELDVRSTKDRGGKPHKGCGSRSSASGDIDDSRSSDDGDDQGENED